ncbi:hypothetical protein PRIPAC_80333 [Pristionchus pacificus]|uniref:Uncharacterized protein n=1 Tax=Pristionchus pacificus TaxID=54126 RepID=A0A2A6C2H0_PRIPA|nr:hypothetical protein PRIPAC_80333 [Pristionchus pacificus]|eukprot:PDM72298.1 hypothetical protein PRIPAC_38732 [Pristionchus pacificus]
MEPYSLLFVFERKYIIQIVVAMAIDTLQPSGAAAWSGMTSDTIPFRGYLERSNRPQINGNLKSMGAGLTLRYHFILIH